MTGGAQTMRVMKRSTTVVDEEEGRRMLKIGDVSKRSGIGVEALRFYEKSGLLERPSRTYSGYRVYGEEVRESVRRRMAELDERLRELHRYRKELKHTLEEWDEVGRAPGHICGLIEGSHVGHAAHHKD